MLILLITSMFNIVFNVSAETNGTIYIRADGSIDPPTAPIQRNGDVYTLTDDILYIDSFWDNSIVAEKDSIVIDGAGYTVRALKGGSGSKGIFLSGRSNVTIKNMEIRGFDWGIIFSDSSENNVISGNNITNNRDGIFCGSSYNNIIRNNITNNTASGIYLEMTSYNSIIGNNIANNGYGIELESSDRNSIIGNNITSNKYDGIRLYGLFFGSSDRNSIIGNNITSNGYGIELYDASNNVIYHNNLINNTRQVFVTLINVWDNGYPSGGNYWSDYTGTDTNGDGVGDIPYIIDANNQDNYPLMSPWLPLQGDINGNRTVDIFDVVLAALAFDSRPGDPNWNQAADINNDNIVDIFDIVLVAVNFGMTA